MDMTHSILLFIKRYCNRPAMAMKSYLHLTFFALVLILKWTNTSAAHLPPPYKEECLTVKYPPGIERSVPTYTVNLDDPPHLRWAEPAKAKSKEMKALFDVVKNLTYAFFHGKAIEVVDQLFPFLVDTLPNPFKDEIKGIAQASGIPEGEMGLLNVFYELFSVCTSIIAEDEKGKLFHGRNLDFGLFLGWDAKTHTWKITEALRPLVSNVVFMKKGKVVFKSVSFIGYVGILTAMKPKVFTLTMNERFTLDGGFVGVFKWLMGDRSSQWMGFLTRGVMENATSFHEAQALLTKTPMLSPGYFILGGNSSGEAVIITRGRNDSETLKMQDWSKKWYLLQTNYDHWKQPLFIDDRRTPGIRCMDQKGRNGSASIRGLFNVLSSRPMLNKLTAYVALMQVNDGTFVSYIQNCSDVTCWGW